MTRIQRDDVVARLRPEDVAEHLDIKGQWRGRWLRSRRCGEGDHSSDAFGLSRDGRWHCHVCDKGGDLLLLLALGLGLDIKADFEKVLEVGAELAGVVAEDPGADMFGLGPQRPPRPERPPLEPPPPLERRLALAKRRAAWVWERLYTSYESHLPATYLRIRGLTPDKVFERETVKATPLKLPADLKRRIQERDPTVSDDIRTLWWTMGTRKGIWGIAVPVRCVSDGAFVDVRVRRVEPLDDQPKIIGMVGNVTAAPAERGKTRQLIGCYGNPYAIDADHVVICEGLLDYLTALEHFPNAQVLGAVEAGTLALVTALAAGALAARDNESQLTIVEQSDPPRRRKDGEMVAGAADQSINEDPNAATKVALRLLRSPGRLGWLYCHHETATVDGKPVKDLNDLVRAGLDPRTMVVRWSDLAS